MNIYDHKVKNSKGEAVSLSQYKGKALLIINTATKCQLTPQYAGLEALYQKFKSKGFEILDFPCNQFMNQAPGSDDQISEFCTLKYHTTFPRFSKVDVNGENADPFFIWLKKQISEDQGDESTKAFERMNKALKPFAQPGDIKWNFGKFLIDKNGNVVARYSPAYTPELLAGSIEKML